MYNWRNMSDAERADVLAARKAREHPWHRPPHPAQGAGTYHLSAACFEHVPVIGLNPKRMAEFEHALFETLQLHVTETVASCVLPNHYHALVATESLGSVLQAMGQMHGRTSHRWNGEEGSRGRKVWYKCMDRAIRSERHYWCTVNYIHNNPVHHGYVRYWPDWPYSSARIYLDAVGREEARRIWLEYPVLDYGKSWDEPGL